MADRCGLCGFLLRKRRKDHLYHTRCKAHAWYLRYKAKKRARRLALLKERHQLLKGKRS